MKSNYKALYELVERIDERNSDGSVTDLLGVSIDKCFIKSVANTNGTDLTKYKVIRKDDFAVSLMQVSRDSKIPVARLDEYDKAIMSPAYPIFRVKDKKVILPEYLDMWFKRPEFDREAAFIAVGGVRGSMPWEEFEKMQLPVPPIEEQLEIVASYKAITDRIALKRRINDNLADLLQTIYQGRFGNDILAVNQGVLSDICSYSTDKVAVSELNVRTYFSTENMLSGKAGSTEATSLPTTSQTTACHKGDTLISNIRPYFKKIVYCEDKCGCSTDVLCFTPSQPCYSAYLFSTLYADKFFAFMVAGSKGTKMPRGDKQQIMTYPVVLPSEEELAGFNTIASPLLEQIYSNRAENKRLSILRDTLLPKLMSGEINVSAIQL